MDTGRQAKNVLAPGASSGIRLAVARSLAAEGANVVLAARRGDLLRAEAARLPAAVGVELDLGEEGAPDRLVEAAERAFGPVDVLVLNSGGPPPGTAADLADEQLVLALHQLLLQAQRLTSRVLPGMRERGWGRIVAVGSSGVQQPLPGLALSNIGRAGLVGRLKTLAAEVAGEGVAVNMVLPGRIGTDRVGAIHAGAAKRTGRSPEEVRARSEGSIPAGRYGRPEEFAAVVTFLAGAPASMMLADFGADVLKVERPPGDDTCHWVPPVDEHGVGTYFSSVNRNKRSVVCDLGTEEGVAAARAIATEADVVIENFRPGVMERYGLDYETLREQRPELIYCSITGFGSGGGAHLPGYDLLVQAVGGLMGVTGSPDSEPSKVGVALVDVVTGQNAVVGIVAALRTLDRTGVGQRIDVNLLSSLLSGLVRVLGIPGLAEDPRFADNSARAAHRDELKALLEDRLRKRPAAQWAELLTDAGVPAGKVNSVAEALELAERLGLAPVVEIADGTGPRRSRQIANPIRMSATPARYRRPPPLLGQHDGASFETGTADPSPRPRPTESTS